MQLNSYAVIFLFIPLTLFFYFLFNHFKRYRLGSAALLLGSLVFYACNDVRHLIYLSISLVLNYVVSRLLLQEGGKGKKKVLLFLAIFINVGILAILKYTNFFIEMLNSLAGRTISLIEFVIPLGISFITFQQIAYLVDSYRQETKAYAFLDYANFITFFSKIISGPIIRHEDMLPQLTDVKNKNLNTENLAKGIQLFAIGLIKKVILAALFSGAVGWGFDPERIPQLSSLEALIVMLSYTFLIYFDFSGYSDMAIGISQMFNLSLPANFNSPYKALSINDFWQRWHISLTTFLRKYIYFPLGGNRKGTFRTYVNIMIIFLVSGLWHGANMTFIVWGALHGIASVLERLFSKSWEKQNPVLKWALTFLFVSAAWVFFASPSVGDAIGLLKQVLRFETFTLSPKLVATFRLNEFEFLREITAGIPLIGTILQHIGRRWLFVLLGFTFIMLLNTKNSMELKERLTVRSSVKTALFMFWGLLSLSNIIEYIYAGF